MAKPRRITSADLPFWTEDIVYLKVRTERKPGMVTGIELRPPSVVYYVSFEDGETAHFPFELTAVYLPDYGTTEDE